MRQPNAPRVWTVAEAKARLSEVLRLAESEGPQRVGIRRPCVVVSAEEWNAKSLPREHLGKWLIDNTPRGADLELPTRREAGRKIPFVDADPG